MSDWSSDVCSSDLRRTGRKARPARSWPRTGSRHGGEGAPMTKFHAVQTNFTAGEVTPLLHARTDLAKYANGARTLTNALVLPHGGATRRSGTRFVAEAKTADGPIRLEIGRASCRERECPYV